jgi:hypothetical protein
MLNFNEFNQLDEFSLRTILTTTLAKVRSAFHALGFGKKVTVRLSLPSINEEVDLKSRLGYLSEYATAAALAALIKGKGLRLSPRSDPKRLMDEYVKRRTEIKRIGAEQSEIDRMEHAGFNMSNQIFDDIVTNGEDLAILTFDIELTGDSGKGVTKADIILTITKDSQKQVVDRIVASLKAYKSATINLSNSTFISLIKTLFYSSGANLPTKTEDFIVRFAKDYGSMEDMRKLYSFQNIIGAEMKSGKSKEDARKTAKMTHGDVIEIIAKIFHTYYPKHKKEMNERMLHMLGFDGDDDFYAAIGEAGKQKVISSRQSKELQQMIAQLSKDFTLTVERNGTTNNANIMFKAPNGDIITKANITFADTGGKAAQGKTNAFVDFKKFIGK